MAAVETKAERPAAAAPGAWAPLGERGFLLLWLAGIVSNVGTWTHDVAAAWLMTSLAPAPIMVALVQAATSLPIFLLALPAGALADLVDRRRLLLALQVAAGALAAVFAAVVAAGLATPGLLLLFTALLGATAALSAPAWQATVPELVPRAMLTQAVALNSVGINIARAIGPALGGLVVTALGLAHAFALNAFSFLAVILALLLWRRPAPAPAALPAERFLAAVRSGLRYARASPPLRATLARAAAFFLPASAVWALLPLVARGPLAGGPGLYGAMLGCVGLGAVAGAVALPRLKARLGPGRLVAAGTGALALAMAVLALLPAVAAALPALLLAGAAWIAVLSSLNASAQLSLPAWVRSRGLAVNLTVFFGCMTAGSVAWGALAGAVGLPATLLAAAAGALAGIAATRRFGLQGGGGGGGAGTLDLEPSGHWPTPPPPGDPAGTAGGGPVMVTVEYRVDPAEGPAFLAAVAELGRERRRDGAFFWQVFADADEPGRWVEAFLLESWLDHLRQHERVTVEDRRLQERVRAFHRGAGPPRVTHLLAAGGPPPSPPRRRGDGA